MNAIVVEVCFCNSTCWSFNRREVEASKYKDINISDMMFSQVPTILSVSLAMDLDIAFDSR